MSVLYYFYAQNRSSLNLVSLLPALQRAVPWISVTEIESNPKPGPDWSSITFKHPELPGASWLYVCFSPASNVKELASLHPTSPLLKTLRKSSIGVWSKVILGASKNSRRMNDRQLSNAIEKWDQLTAAFAKHCDGIVDIPENERLYSSRQYAVYIARLAKQRQSYSL